MIVYIAIALLCLGCFRGPFHAREKGRDMLGWIAVVLAVALVMGWVR